MSARSDLIGLLTGPCMDCGWYGRELNDAIDLVDAHVHELTEDLRTYAERWPSLFDPKTLRDVADFIDRGFMEGTDYELVP